MLKTRGLVADRAAAVPPGACRTQAEVLRACTMSSQLSSGRQKVSNHGMLIACRLRRFCELLLTCGHHHCTLRTRLQGIGEWPSHLQLARGAVGASWPAPWLPAGRCAAAKAAPSAACAPTASWGPAGGTITIVRQELEASHCRFSKLPYADNPGSITSSRPIDCGGSDT